MTKPHIVIIGTGGTIVSSGASGAQMTGYSIQRFGVDPPALSLQFLLWLKSLTLMPCLF